MCFMAHTFLVWRFSLDKEAFVCWKYIKPTCSAYFCFWDIMFDNKDKSSNSVQYLLTNKNQKQNPHIMWAGGLVITSSFALSILNIIRSQELSWTKSNQWNLIRTANSYQSTSWFNYLSEIIINKVNSIQKITWQGSISHILDKVRLF